jgi:hypothetical protein
MYDINKIWKNALEYLKLSLNSEISTDGIYHAIENTTSFTRQKTIRSIIINLEKHNFIRRSEKIGIWIICKIFENKDEKDWFEV